MGKTFFRRGQTRDQFYRFWRRNWSRTRTRIKSGSFFWFTRLNFNSIYFNGSFQLILKQYIREMTSNQLGNYQKLVENWATSRKLSYGQLRACSNRIVSICLQSSKSFRPKVFAIIVQLHIFLLHKNILPLQKKMCPKKFQYKSLTHNLWLIYLIIDSFW